MTLLLVYLLFVGVHVLASQAGPLPPTYDGSICLEASSCGGVQIKYPFYLANATTAIADYTTYFCGYTDLKIFCQDGIPTMELSQYMYTVKDIYYNTNTILLAHADAFLGGNDGCPVVHHNTSFSPDWLRYKDSSFDNITFFLSCYSEKPLPTELHQYQIDFPGFHSAGTGASLVFSSEQHDAAREHDLDEHCDQMVVVPALRDSLHNLFMLPKEYGSVLRQGFELEWNRITTDQCHLCEQSSGRCSYSQNRVFLGCLCSDEKMGCRDSSFHTIASPSRTQNRTTIYIIASALCLLLSSLVILALYLIHKYSCSQLSETKDASRIKCFLQKNENIHPKRYTYKEVKRMTNSFSVKLGQGGFGTVYKGNLPNGREAAVKVLKDTKGNGEEFINEVSSISRTSHVNIVSLLGFCLQGSFWALLYEYMPNSSLERYAFNNNVSCEYTLTWEKLFEITIGVARGLEYLHRGCNTRIVHFDIKPHNILLDQDFCPKISDFGLAMLCLNKESDISIVGARGTIGYIAPEVYSKHFGMVSSKSDVYSYGMMVLEMVGARDKKTSVNSELSSQYFPQWIYKHLDDYCISASEVNGETTKLIRKMIVVGLWCIQVTPTHRPTMTRVVEMLEGTTSTLELPPKMLLTMS